MRLVLICVLLVARASTFSGGWGGTRGRGSMCGRRLQRPHRCRVANACCMRLKQPYVPEAAVWFACPPSHPGGACSNSYPRAFTSHRHRAAAGAGAAAAASNHSAGAAASRGPGNGAAAAAAAVCAGMKHARRSACMMMSSSASFWWPRVISSRCVGLLDPLPERPHLEWLRDPINLVGPPRSMHAAA